MGSAAYCSWWLALLCCFLCRLVLLSWPAEAAGICLPTSLAAAVHQTLQPWHQQQQQLVVVSAVASTAPAPLASQP